MYEMRRKASGAGRCAALIGAERLLTQSRQEDKRIYLRGLLGRKDIDFSGRAGTRLESRAQYAGVMRV